jgi:dipeptidyl aminopeptidase/acylaminoacyl peptidase
MKVVNKTFFCISSLLLWSAQVGADSPSLRIRHPVDPRKEVEYFLEHPAGRGPWATIIILHGYQEGERPGGKEIADWGLLKQLSGRGYLAVAISQPGYGRSAGPPDFCGVFTQHAVAGVMAQLRAQGLASRNKLVIEGISRGALTAGLVAAEDSGVSGLVLISGVYDLQAYIADSNPSAAKKNVVESIFAETGGTPDALAARSVLSRARGIKASVLILNGAKDDRTDPNQAQALAELITRAGGKARAIIYPDFGHQIPVDVRSKDVDPFIDKLLGPSP